jgi:polyisoprenyl-teichoic acid--peptidoglycan teichoic acid transferase
MRKLVFDKSHILLWIIIGLFILAAGLGVFILKGEKVDLQLKTDRPINILIIFENGGRPLSSQLLMFYPSKSKAALLDIPSNMAVILKTIKRMDRIDLSYKAGHPKNFITEVESYLDISINGYMLFDETGLSRMVDLLDGLPLFIPSMIIQDGKGAVRLPGGAVVLDGEKVEQYLVYKDEAESESDSLARRQKLATALLRKLSEKSKYLSANDSARILTASFKSDLGMDARKKLLKEMSSLDADSIFMQKITGTYRSVDNQRLFFPFYDGELARDMLKQTLSAMNQSAAAASGGKIYTVEILNGTSEKGLASRTADIFESFGYEVVSVGNAAKLDYTKTEVIDRYGDKQALAAVANVIRCEKFADAAEYQGSIKADYSIILGSDFDGRICVR